jgi:hypothetical protein
MDMLEVALEEPRRTLMDRMGDMAAALDPLDSAGDAAPCSGVCRPLASSATDALEISDPGLLPPSSNMEGREGRKPPRFLIV